MSDSTNKDDLSNKKTENQNIKNNRSTSPNPFLPFMSTSPKNISPRSDAGSTNSPRSPRDVNGSPRDMFMGGEF